jgi:glutamine amidotransferase
MIGLVNYGIGNLGSIQIMIENVGGKTTLVSNAKEIKKIKKIIIPGVGHFSDGVHALKRLDLWNPILDYSNNNDSLIMGICLGMHLLCKYSEEGNIQGLGLVDANVIKFNFSDQPNLKVPHMGWNTLRSIRDNALIPVDNYKGRFYFAHSYKVAPNNLDISIGQCDYGGEFCAAFQQDNVFGVQFHPEKSHRFGMALMKRFVDL